MLYCFVCCFGLVGGGVDEFFFRVLFSPSPLTFFLLDNFFEKLGKKAHRRPVAAAGNLRRVDRRRRHQRPARGLGPRDVAARRRVVAVRRVPGRRRLARVVVEPDAGVDEVREAGRVRGAEGLRERALRAAAREVGEGGVGDDVDGDLRDPEVVAGVLMMAMKRKPRRRRLSREFFEQNEEKQKKKVSFSSLSLFYSRLKLDLKHGLGVLPEGLEADGVGRDVVFLFFFRKEGREKKERKM